MPDELNHAAGELVACLCAQAEQLRAFLDLLARQRDALVKRDSDLLNHLMAQQERAIAAARRLEQQRQALTARVMESTGSEPGTLSLTDIAALIAASDAARLNELQETLRGLEREIDRRKRLNTKLIEQSLRCTGETLKWVAGQIGARGVYSPGPNVTTSDPGQIAVNRRC